MAEAFSMSRASDLVGKTVIVTNEAGQQVQGKVDYVTYKSGEAYLNIDGTDYKMEDVSSVADSHFVEIHDQADDLMEMMEKFPVYENMVFTDADAIYKAFSFYENMDADAVALLDQADISKLEKYYKRAQELVQEANQNQADYEARQKEEQESKIDEITNDPDEEAADATE